MDIMLPLEKFQHKAALCRIMFFVTASVFPVRPIATLSTSSEHVVFVGAQSCFYASIQVRACNKTP